MKKSTPVRIAPFLLAICLWATTLTSPAQNNMKDDIPTINYSEDKNWSILCSDIQHKIDVFFVHSTTYGPPANGNYIASLDDSVLNHKTDHESIFRITEAFNKQCNVFAPRYRQMNIEVLSMNEDTLNVYLQTPKQDAFAAFTYYLENLNQGRPFILAAHSQGSYMLKLILHENPNLLDKEKLVVAYLPGWTFTTEDMGNLGIPFGEKPDQTGCLVAWNTIGPGGISPVLQSKDALCVNPLSWTTDKNEYPADMHVCTQILLSPGRELKLEKISPAKINNYGGLEISEPEPELKSQLNMSMGPHCYHLYDYDFFFYNIQENVAVRCKAYLEKQ